MLTSVLMKLIIVLVMLSVSTMKEVSPVPVRQVFSQITWYPMATEAIELQRPSSVLTRTNVNLERINAFHQIHIAKIPKATEL